MLEGLSYSTGSAQVYWPLGIEIGILSARRWRTGYDDMLAMRIELMREMSVLRDADGYE